MTVLCAWCGDYEHQHDAKGCIVCRSLSPAWHQRRRFVPEAEGIGAEQVQAIQSGQSNLNNHKE